MRQGPAALALLSALAWMADAEPSLAQKPSAERPTYEVGIGAAGAADAGNGRHHGRRSPGGPEVVGQLDQLGQITPHMATRLTGQARTCHDGYMHGHASCSVQQNWWWPPN